MEMGEDRGPVVFVWLGTRTGSSLSLETWVQPCVSPLYSPTIEAHNGPGFSLFFFSHPPYMAQK